MKCYYFGTFNPPHKGHTKTAYEVKKLFGFDEVVFVPAAYPPHKTPEIAPVHRLNMAKLIENDEIKVSDIEFKLPRPSYSYRTIKKLRQQGEKLNFIIGFDAFKHIGEWKNPEFLKENLRFIVLKRRGECRFEIENMKNSGYDFEIADSIDFIDISSTEIREKIKTGKSVKGLVDEKVERYIKENGLYGN